MNGWWIHTLFEAQARRTPDRPAVACDGRQLTYRELDEQASELADRLRDLGVGSQSLVGLAVDRSVRMIVGMMGILKAGAAYVPLALDNPKARLAQQLAVADALVAEQSTAALMPPFAGALVCLDETTARQNGAAAQSNRQSGPDDLVYVIYTSGSTGVPKGVAVRHRNLVNYTSFIVRRLELDAFPGGLQFASVSTLAADLGNTCIFPSLVSGGCLHVIPHDIATDADRLAGYMAEHPIDVLKIVPSHLRALVDAGQSRVLPRQWLITGGETLMPDLVGTVRALNPEVRLLNHYGPTETTVGSLTLALSEYDAAGSQAASIPIGQPIANTQAYVLDDRLEPAPAGVAGELYIGGAGVSAGYLNQPELTDERFIADPFAPGAKMYRTGDRARRLPDGNIEFLGRVDAQVKIRGFRIELGEIEAALARHPDVKQAVVLTRDDEVGEKRLVAYVVAGREVAPDSVRDHLKDHVPDYMVPQSVVALDRMPLTPNGKIDRQALATMGLPDVQPERSFTAPRTETEAGIAAIWREFLKVDRVGIHDNFFDLGGHSLLAIQVVSRIRRSLNVDLPPQCIFTAPTIAELAARVQIPADGRQAPSLVPLVRRAPRANAETSTT